MNQFLAMLAHELRNPISVIVNGIQLLDAIQGTDSPDIRAMFEIRATMLRQAKHLTRLVDDLLDVSRITRGKVVLRQQVMAANEAIIGAIEMSKVLATEKRQEVQLHLSGLEGKKINGDKTRLIQVFSNLINNAMKYTPQGGLIEIHINSTDTEIIFSIRDNGVGIAAENIDRIFDIFFQVDNSLDRSQGGLGIGLTLCKDLVTMHGGSIIAKSEGLGKGSEFIVTLPIVLSNSKVILIVDDVKESAIFLEKFFEMKGQIAHSAINGKEAIEMVQTIKPEVILLDIGLPEMDGYEICRRIRKLPDAEKVVICALTGYSSEEDQLLAKKAGFNYHFVKPLDIGKFMEEVLSD